MRSPRHVAALIAVSWCVATEARAAEQLVGVSLEWTRGPGAEACLSGAVLRDEVRRRVTADPFRPPYSIYLEGYAERQGDTWTATVYLHRDDTTTVRSFSSATADCAPLGEAVALAAALLIDPNAKLVVAPEPPAPPPAPDLAPEAAAVPPEPSPAPAPPPSEPPSHAYAVVAAQLTTSAVAAPSAGAVAGVEIETGPHFAARGGFAYVPERRATTGEGAIGLGITAFSGGACGGLAATDWLTLRGCGDVLAGGIYAVVFDGVPEHPGMQRWAAVSASAEGVVSITGAIAVVAGGGVWAPLIRHGFRVSGSNALIFRQPAVIPSGTLGVRLKL